MVPTRSAAARGSGGVNVTVTDDDGERTRWVLGPFGLPAADPFTGGTAAAPATEGAPDHLRSAWGSVGGVAGGFIPDPPRLERADIAALAELAYQAAQALAAAGVEVDDEEMPGLVPVEDAVILRPTRATPVWDGNQASRELEAGTH